MSTRRGQQDARIQVEAEEAEVSGRYRWLFVPGADKNRGPPPEETWNDAAVVAEGRDGDADARADERRAGFRFHPRPVCRPGFPDAFELCQPGRL